MNELDKMDTVINNWYLIYAILQGSLLSLYMVYTDKERNGYSAIEVVISYITPLIITVTIAPIFTYIGITTMYKRMGVKQKCLNLLKKFWNGTI